MFLRMIVTVLACLSFMLSDQQEVRRYLYFSYFVFKCKFIHNPLLSVFWQLLCVNVKPNHVTE